MQAVFADPKTTFVFKRIFGTEARKPLLVALLNHLLELEGDREIRHLEHLSTEQHVDVPELKLSIVDVKCTDASGRRFVVEIQVLKVEGFEKRVVYNASKSCSSQRRTVCVTCEIRHPLVETSEASYSSRVPFRYSMTPARAFLLGAFATHLTMVSCAAHFGIEA